MRAGELTMVWVCGLSIGVLLYVYAGYPVLLRTVVRLRGARPVRRRDITPPISLVISAYNEQDVIAAKLENALALDYPREALEIVVISDASSDATDAIVERFADRGVRLRRQPNRAGKTEGLNRVVPTLGGEIVVFSDANAFYRPDALRKLARNFADPGVGCATGEARYLEEGESAADRGERTYWGYEMALKRLETDVCSMVGGDGALYAIRRSLWKTLPPTAINDFLNPLQIVEAGWRAVYEPAAVCDERTAGAVGREYRRRIRIVSRSWRAVFQARGVLNPFRVGLFSLLLVSHKMLRWLSMLFLLTGGTAGLLLLAPWIERLDPAVAGVAAGVLAIALLTRPARRVVGMGAYFLVISAASLVGVVKGSMGAVPATWATPRADEASRVAPALPALAALGTAGALVVPASLWWPDTTAVAIFWGSVLVLAYVYAGYPVLAAWMAHRYSRPVRRGPALLPVCLLITAHDEEGVIASKLENALALEYPRDLLQILVVSDGSTDRTAEIVRGFASAGVELIDLPRRRGKPSAIKAGMAATEAEIVVLSDADTLLDREALRHLVAAFADPDVGGVSGDVRVTGGRAALGISEDLYYRYERWVQRSESEVWSMVGADGGLYAVRRALFPALPSDTILDDLAIPMAVVRQGRRIVLEPAARAIEQGPRTARDEFARKVRIAAGAVQYLVRGGWRPAPSRQVFLAVLSHKALRWMAPLLGVLAVAAALGLAPGSPFYATAVIVAAGMLLTGLVGCVAPLRRCAPVAVLHFLCLTHAAAVVGLVRGCAGRQAVTWRRFVRAPVR
jgi:cellulose synthase/poly-beta-1,6-N-acetylglucosamine synthase-like glycosyltransferase